MPTNEQELETRYCAKLKPWFKCMNRFRPCLIPLQKIVYDAITNQFKEYFRGEICSDSSARTKTIEALKCFAWEDIDIMRDAMTKFTVILSNAEKYDEGKMLGYLCCSYSLFYEFMDIRTGAVCDRKGMPRTVFFTNSVKALGGFAHELGCPVQYNSDKECTKSLPEAVAEMRSIIYGELKENVGFSMLGPMLKIIKEMAS